jgi:plastocyanin
MENESVQQSETKKSSSGLPILIGVVLIAVAGLVGWMLLGKQQSVENSKMDEPEVMEEQKTSMSPSVAVMDSTSSAAESGNVKSFTVKGQNFSFSPNVLKVKKGDTVKITFENSGGTHDFVIDEFNVRVPQIQGGQSQNVEFVASKAGTFEFYCSVGQHRKMGMKGNLIVE